MTVFLDPNEASPNTRLPTALVKASIICKELETFTASDMLISTISTPSLEQLSETRPSQIALRKHLNHGMLVQRKTTDLVPSLPELKRILNTMLSFNPKYGCWLLFVGDLYVKDGQPMIDGQPIRGFPNLSYGNLLQTFMKWQFRGHEGQSGYVAWVKYDEGVTAWVNAALSLMTALEEAPEISVSPRKAVQRMIMDQDAANKPWRDTLMTIPGIGASKSKALGEVFPSLWQCLCFMSDLSNLTSQYKPSCIHLSDFQSVIYWLGLRQGDVLTNYDTLAKRRIEHYDAVNWTPVYANWEDLDVKDEEPPEPKEELKVDNEVVDLPWN